MKFFFYKNKKKKKKFGLPWWQINWENYSSHIMLYFSVESYYALDYRSFSFFLFFSVVSARNVCAKRRYLSIFILDDKNEYTSSLKLY